MPTWQPNWTNVDFDFVGADEAISDCRSLRRLLEDREPVLARPVALAREEWRGSKRVLFDNAEAATQRDIQLLIEELRQMEQRTAAAISAANDEQVRRIRQRSQWYGELQIEQEAERQQAN